jgi:hypothetical protein
MMECGSNSRSTVVSLSSTVKATPLRALRLVGHFDIEMQHLLSRPQLFVQRNRGVIAVVGLNIDDPYTAPGGDLAQAFD